MPEPSSEANLARLTALLETLQRQVVSMEARLNAEFVTARDLSGVRDAVSELRVLLSKFTVELRDDLRLHQRELYDELKGYVTEDGFDPVKRIVYGLVGLLLTSMAGALAALLFNTRGGP